jgi:Phage integrase family
MERSRCFGGRRDQAERRLLLGEAWNDLGVVVERGDGRPIHPDVFSRRFARLVQRLGLPTVRLHDLRHAYATRLLEAGVHPKVVADLLGHASSSFTMDTYSHVVSVTSGGCRCGHRGSARWRDRKRTVVTWRHSGGTSSSADSTTRYGPANPQVDRWGGQDLNLRPTDYESAALTD